MKKTAQAKRANERRIGRIRNTHKRPKRDNKDVRPGRLVLHDPPPGSAGGSNG